MVIKERIKLGNNDYYIQCDCEYKTKDKFTKLCLKKYKDSYYDGGDLSILIKKIEENYDAKVVKKYDGEIWFLADCLYIYENIPFISGVGIYYISSKDNIINSESYITKEELDKYIKDNNIKIDSNPKFRLCDSRTWEIN